MVGAWWLAISFAAGMGVGVVLLVILMLRKDDKDE